MGCAHSPSALAMSNEVLISMKKFNNVIEIAPDKMEIDVESGVLFSTLNELLPQFGLSLPIQASSNSITVGGAISTATHGSGRLTNVY
jgi:FAD/FMN-containing dehydrogenase